MLGRSQINFVFPNPPSARLEIRNLRSVNLCTTAKALLVSRNQRILRRWPTHFFIRVQDSATFLVMVKTNREENRRLSDPVHKGQSARTAYEGGEPLGWVEIQQTWKFVDRVNHGCLMVAMARARADKRMMKLIRDFWKPAGLTMA